MHIPTNRVRDIERYFHTELAGLYPDTEIGAFVDILFEAYMGWNKAQLLLHRNDTINQSDLLRFHWAAEDLKQYRPIQYIVGHTDFCGLRLHVEPGVLIPRPETEEIVERITTHLERSATQWQGMPSPSTILDLCTPCHIRPMRHPSPRAFPTPFHIRPHCQQPALCLRQRTQRHVAQRARP